VQIFEYLCAAYPDKALPHIVNKVNHKRSNASVLYIMQVHAAGDLAAAEIAGLKEVDELCGRAMIIFLTHLGGEAGAAALKWLPFGGETRSQRGDMLTLS